MFIMSIGGKSIFLKLIYRILIKLKDAFYRLDNFKYFFRYSMSKSEATIGLLWETQIKTLKKGYFTKILSSPIIF